MDFSKGHVEICEASPLGKPVVRLDAYDKATGKALYTEDIQWKFKNLLHIKVLRSPYAHAKILSFDFTQAQKLSGVKAILTGKDCPRTYERSEVFSFPCEGDATWAGQGVAAVAAISEEIALQALELIKVEYQVLPAVITLEEAMKENPVSVVDPKLGTYPGHIFKPEAPNIVSHQKVRTGDIELGFAQADVIVENEYYAARNSHSQMERASCIVNPDPDGKGITLYSNGCGVHNPVKALICPLFGLEYSRVVIKQMTQGGSFGNRLISSVEPLCTLFALKTRRPCKLTFSRQEMFIASPSNWPVKVLIKTGATKEGILTAQQMTVIEDGGAHQNNGRDGRSTASAAVPVYRVPNFHQDIYEVNTNTPPVGSLRGLGAPQMAFAVENQISAIAHALGMSQLEIREKNIMHNGEVDAYGETLTSTGAAACIAAVNEAIGMDVPAENMLGEDWRVGRGISVAGKQNTPLGRSEAEVRVYGDGSIEVLVGCDENGMGAMTTMGMITAHEFEVPLAQVKVRLGNSEVVPYDNFSASSRTTYNTGNAVMLACRDAKRQLCVAAGEIAGVHPEYVEIKGGFATAVGGTMDPIPLKDLFHPFSPYQPQQDRKLKKMSFVRGYGVFAPAPAVKWDPEVGHTKRMWNWYQYNACGAEVAVNIHTGETKILRFASASDMGFPINPIGCEGQMQGGLVMAGSFSRNEEYVYDEEGKILNGSFMDYRVSTVLDTPKRKDYICCFCPDPLPDGPYGAKGIAESITTPVGPAIAEAIYQAVGVRPKKMPMSAESILKMMQEKEK